MHSSSHEKTLFITHSFLYKVVNVDERVMGEYVRAAKCINKENLGEQRTHYIKSFIPKMEKWMFLSPKFTLFIFRINYHLYNNPPCAQNKTIILPKAFLVSHVLTFIC